VKPYAVVEDRSKPFRHPRRYRIELTALLRLPVSRSSVTLLELFESVSDAESFLSKLH
jgi:hypothetical protein